MDPSTKLLTTIYHICVLILSSYVHAIVIIFVHEVCYWFLISVHVKKKSWRSDQIIDYLLILVEDR